MCPESPGQVVRSNSVNMRCQYEMCVTSLCVWLYFQMSDYGPPRPQYRPTPYSEGRYPPPYSRGHPPPPSRSGYGDYPPRPRSAYSTGPRPPYPQRPMSVYSGAAKPVAPASKSRLCCCLLGFFLLILALAAVVALGAYFGLKRNKGRK